MALSGYLNIDDIAGEAQHVGHENEIDVQGVQWSIERASPTRGAGRARARAQVSSLTCVKYADASSPYLALACLQGKSISSAVLTLTRNSVGRQLDYLIITMENVLVAGFDMANDASDTDDDAVTEHVSFVFEKVTYRYIVQTADGSAGDTHEIDYDIAAGV